MNKNDSADSVKQSVERHGKVSSVLKEASRCQWTKFLKRTIWIPFLIWVCIKLIPSTDSIGLISVVNTGFADGEQRVEVSGTTVCVSGDSIGVKFFSLTNPVAPSLIAAVNVPGTTHAIGHSDDYFYLAGDGWLRTFRCASNSFVTTNGTYTNFPSPARNCTKMLVYNGLIFMGTSADGLSAPGAVCIFSLTNPAAPVFVSSATGPAGSSMADVAVKDNVLYTCDYSKRQIDVFDITDIENSTFMNAQTVSNRGDYYVFEPWRLLIKDDALYVQDDNTWQIFNISNPNNPVFSSAFQVEKDIEGSRLVGDMLLWSASGAAGGVSSVLLYDCRDALNPVFFCRTNFQFYTGYCSCDMDENFIYQAAASSLHILSRPQLPPPNSSPLNCRGRGWHHARRKTEISNSGFVGR